MVASRFGQPTTLSLNNGSGIFTDSGQTLGTANNTGVAFGDLDGDGDLDVMLTNWGEGNTVWLNNGSGTFTDSGQTLGTADSWKATFGDIDGDGDLDAAVANRSGQADTVWLNNGSGTFTDSGQTLGTADGYKVALGDVDGDGDLDAITANLGVANVVWLNNLPPTADVGGPYTITEGDSVMLDASATSDPDSDPLTYSWDLDNDATFGDVTGETPTVTWAQLQSFGIDDDGVYPIAVEVDDGTITDTDATTLTVDNFVPVLSTTGASSVTVSTVYTLTLGVTDPGDDTISGWTINWGDGTIDPIVGNPSSATHTYTRLGYTFDILASATDEDGTWLQNELLIPSYDASKVFRYEETTGDYLQQWAVGSNPLAHLIGPDGRLYVSNEGDNNVTRYNAETGADLGVFASGGGLSSPEGATFGPDGHLYVAGWTNSNVLRFDGSSGVFIDTFTSGTAVTAPVGVVFGPDGNLYVGSYSGDYVNRYNGTTGVFIDQFVGVASGGLDQPHQMTFGPDGNLYIASRTSGQVLRYNGTTGVFIDVFVAAGGAGALDNPSGLAFGPDGHLYVNEIADATILRYHGTTGAFIDVYVAAGSGGLTSPHLMGFLPKQQVLVVDGPQADLSGSLVPDAAPAEIVAGTETLIITLVGDSWVPTVGDDNAITTALINGIDSAQSESNGWDLVVKAGTSPPPKPSPPPCPPPPSSAEPRSTPPPPSTSRRPRTSTLFLRGLTTARPHSTSTSTTPTATRSAMRVTRVRRWHRPVRSPILVRHWEERAA